MSVGLPQERAVQLGFEFIPHVNIKQPLISQKLPHRIMLTRHEQGGYDVLLPHLENGQHYQLFDGDICVADVYKTHNGIEIDATTTQQLNFSGEAAAPYIKINAVGPIVIQADMTCEELEVQAKSACFSGKIDAKVATMHCDNGLVLSGACNLNVMICEAETIFQAGALTVREYLDINANLYEQSAPVVTQKDCRIFSTTLYIDDDFTVGKKAFFAADQMVVGEGQASVDQQIHVKLPPATHLRARACCLEGSSQLVVKANADQSANIQIDYFDIKASCAATLTHVNMTDDVIRNHGKLEINDSRIEANRISQFGDAKITYAHLHVNEVFDACHDTKIVHSEVSAGLFNSEINTSLTDCELDVVDLVVNSGKFSADAKTNMYLRSALVQKESSFDLHDARLVTASQFLSYGSCNFQSVDHFEARFADFYGDVHAAHCSFTPKRLQFFGDNLFLTQCHGDVDAVKFKPGAGDFVLDQTEFSTRYLLQQGKLSLQHYTTLFGLQEEQACFLFEGDLHCEQSRIVTPGSVYLKNQSSVQQLRSTIQAKHIESKAKMSAEESLMFAETFRQKDASLGLDRTRVYSTEFSSAASELSAKKAKVLADKFNHQGELHLNDAEIQSADQRVQAASLDSADVAISPKQTRMGDETVATDMQLMANEVQLYDSFEIENAVIAAKKYVSMQPGSRGKFKKTVVRANDVDVHGELVTEDASLQAEHYLITRPGSKITAEGSLALQSSHRAYLQGSIEKVDSTDVIEAPAGEGENAADEMPVDGKPARKTTVVLAAKDEADIASMATIDVDQLAVESETVKNRGIVHAHSDLQIKGGMLYNQNKISAEKAAAFYLNYGLANLGGTVSAENVAIQGNLFNLFGGVFAEKNYTQHGFVGLNAGILQGANVVSSNLLSVNAGLVLPNFSADPRFWFSSQNLYAVARTTLAFALPQFNHTINLAFSVPSFIGGALGLYRLASKYDSWDKLKNAQLFELMPAISQIKNAVTMTMGAVTHMQSLNAEFKGLADVDWGQSALYDVNWAQLGKQSLTILGGHYVDDSLVSINTGLSFAQSTAKTSFVDLNVGVQASLQNHSVNTYWMGNAGFSGGDQSGFSATNGINAGMLYGRDGLRLDFNDLHNAQDGIIAGSKVSGHIGDFQQDGEIDWEDGAIVIDRFNENDSACDRFQNMHISGDTATFSGVMRAKGVQFDYQTSIELDKAWHGNVIDTSFKTAHFSDKGQMEYAGTVSIQAEEVTLAEDSQVKGAVSEKVTSNEHDAADENDVAEGEAEAVPEHVLLINAKQARLDGKLAGGDYTQIAGVRDAEGQAQKCERLDVGEHAEIELDGAYLAAESSEVAGQLTLTNAQAELDKVEILVKGALGLSNAVMTGESLRSSGKLDAEHASVQYESAHFSEGAKEHLADNAYLKFGSFTDDSQMFYRDQVFIETDQYQHGGHIALEGSDEDDYFSLQANQASLNGSAAIGRGAYDIKTFQDGVGFVTGTGSYSDYQFSKQLNYKTEDSLRVNDALLRDADLFVQAADIQWDVAVKGDQWIGLESTAGDVSVTKDLSVGGFWAKSAGDVYTNHVVDASGNIQVQADGAYYNLGGTLNGESVSVTAAEIFNVTAGSAYASQGDWGYRVGSGGVINGRQQTLLESTVGNIENHGGVIRGGEYAQLVAKGDVKNICNVRSYQGAHDVIQEFDPGLITGGAGSEATNGIGLYVQAEGSVFADASDFVANGDVYIDGEQGVEFAARSHTYISRDETKRKWHGGKKHIVETSTNIRGCNIQSSSGRNIIYSEEGGVTGVAANFISPGGTDVYADKKVQFFSLKTQDRRYESKRGALGLSHSKRTEYHEASAPTLFLDNGLTRVHSASDSVDLRGALFLGEGDLEIKAKKKILFGCDVLNHSVHEETYGFGVSLPGSGGWSAYQSGGNLWDVATAEDATLSKMNSMFGSENALEYLTSGVNLGIDLFNTSNSFMRGLAEDSFGAELLARYGLGGADGFMPRASFSFTHTKTDSSYQTLGAGGVDRGGDVSYTAGEGIELHNGVQVKNAGDAEVNAPTVELHAAELHSTFKHEEQTVSVGITPAGVSDVGASASKTTSECTSHVNARLACDGHMKLHHNDEAVDHVLLNGGTLEAGSMDAGITQLDVIDKVDTSRTTTESASASTSGQVSAYKGKGSEAVVGESSGIHVTAGLNTGGHQFEVDRADMVGGKIKTDGENHAVIHELHATAVEESREYTGVGVSFNVNDLSRLSGDSKPSNEAGEQAIATGSVFVDRERYEATVKPVVHGAQGSYAQIGKLLGDVRTDSSDGRDVHRDSSLHMTVDVPLTNQEYIAQARKNIREGSEKIGAYLSPDKKGQLEGEVPELDLPDVPGSLDVAEALEVDTADIDVDLDATDLPELTPELLNQVFDNMDEAEKADFNDSLQQASRELETKGEISEATEILLMDKFAEAVIKTMKASGEYGWDKIVGALGKEYSDGAFKMLLTKGMRDKGGVKLYMTSKGVMFSFVMNLALTGASPGTDQLKDAAIATGDGLLVGFIIGRAAGAAAPYVTFAVTALDILDGLTYDEARVQAQFERAQDLRAAGMDAVKKGDWYSWFGGQGLLIMSRDLQQGAALSQGLHESLKILGPIKMTKDYLKSKNSQPDHPPSSASAGFFSHRAREELESSTSARQGAVSS